MSSEESDEGRHHSPPMSPRLRCLRDAMENRRDVIEVKKALESGANANGTWSWLPDNPNYSYTPTPALFHAVLLSSSVRVIRLLVKYGADLDQQVEHWGGPLHMACRLGNVALVKELIRLGADVFSPNEFNWQPIVLAAIGANSSCIDLLLKAGADINTGHDSERDGDTPLATAVTNYSWKTTQHLLKRGARADVSFCSGHSLMDGLRWRIESLEGDIVSYDGNDYSVREKDRAEHTLRVLISFEQHLRREHLFTLSVALRMLDLPVLVLLEIAGFHSWFDKASLLAPTVAWAICKCVKDCKKRNLVWT
jgi:hypothetical protein